jgi:hypothetical protein
MHWSCSFGDARSRLSDRAAASRMRGETKGGPLQNPKINNSKSEKKNGKTLA